MTARKILKTAALFLTVSLVVLALTPGLAPAIESLPLEPAAAHRSLTSGEGSQLIPPLAGSYAAATTPTPEMEAAAASALAGLGMGQRSNGMEYYPYAASGPESGTP